MVLPVDANESNPAAEPDCDCDPDRYEIWTEGLKSHSYYRQNKLCCSASSVLTKSLRSFVASSDRMNR